MRQPQYPRGVCSQWLHPRFRVQCGLSHSQPVDPQRNSLAGYALVGVDRFLSPTDTSLLTSANLPSNTLRHLGPLILENPERTAAALHHAQKTDATEMDEALEEWKAFNQQHQRQSDILDAIAWLLNGTFDQKRVAIQLIGEIKDLSLIHI